MSLGLTHSNGKPAVMARGRYTTRNNRVVDITGSHVETGITAGQAWSKTMWDGVLYAANMRDVESRHSWSNEGGYLHQEGVGNEFDLRTVISQEFDPEPVAPLAHTDPALLEHQLLCTALVDILSNHKDLRDDPDETPVATLNRIIAERDAAVKSLGDHKIDDTSAKELELIKARLDAAISERDVAKAQVAALLSKPATQTVTS